MALENGAQAGCVFWQVGSSATLAGGTFNGTILALTSISIASTASVTGRLLAENGAVTLVDDTIARAASVHGFGIDNDNDDNHDHAIKNDRGEKAND